MTKFIENFNIYYINLANRLDREEEFNRHTSNLEFCNLIRVDATNVENLLLSTLNEGIRLGATPVEVACSGSHIKALKKFVDESSDAFAVICEDDADLTNLSKLEFTVTQLFKALGKNVGCIQLGVSTREELSISFTPHRRSPWDFNASTYLVSREYAKELLKKFYVDGEFTLINFKPITIFDYRSGSHVESTPVSEWVIYNEERTVTIPLCTYSLSSSSIQTSSESERQNIKSKNSIDGRWSDYDSIYLDDLFEDKTSFFSVPKISETVITSKVKIVIPWRASESRLPIFKRLIAWYAIQFPSWEIVLADSGSEIFNLAASRNVGANQAFGLGADVVLISDADFFPSKDSVVRSVIRALRTDHICTPYYEYRELSYEGTEQFLAGNSDSMDMDVKRNYLPKLVDGKTDRFWVCSGMFVITKKLFEEFGGFDENFEGWGQEDIDYHKRYLDKYGRLFDYVDGVGLSLEHSREEWMMEDGRNRDYFVQKHGDQYIL